MTTPLAFTWPHLVLFWSVYVWVFIPELRIMRRTRLVTPAPIEDRGSLRVLAVGFTIATTAAFGLPFLVPRAQLPGSRVAWFATGVITLIAGSLLRRHCFRVLGALFTGAVTIQDDHHVIDSGAYRWLRHPSYSGALLIVLGISLSVGNWLSVLVSLLVAFPVYAYRAHVEEQALTASLGDSYRLFAASRKRFIPFIY